MFSIRLLHRIIRMVSFSLLLFGIVFPIRGQDDSSRAGTHEITPVSELIDVWNAAEVRTRSPLLIAHRGGVVDSATPECSRMAVKLAAAHRYDMVELDIRESRDHHPVVFHDQNMTDACGIDGNVSDYTLEAVTQIHFLNSTETVTSLDSMLGLCRSLNLGVMFDECLKMNEHITAVCRTSYFHLRNVRTLKPFLSYKALLTVVHAFITSRIDYGNSLLYGISDHNLNRLQRVQNSAARIVTNTSKYDHITPVLYKLHWLPVRYRIHYKIILTTFKAIHGLSPSYITELIRIKDYHRSLRSSSCITLLVPTSRLKTFGDSSFSVAAPKLWNALPNNIKNSKSVDCFKSLIKTHLFNVAFAV